MLSKFCYSREAPILLRIFIERIPSSEKEDMSDIQYSCYSQTLQQKEAILPAIELARVLRDKIRAGLYSVTIIRWA